MFGSYSYTNTNNIRVLNTSEIESLDLCKNTRACLDPKKKIRLNYFYSNLSKCGTRVNEVQSLKLL